MAGVFVLYISGMDIKEAIRISRKIFMAGIFIALVIAYSIMSVLAGYKWIIEVDFVLNVLTGVAGILISGYVFSAVAAKLIFVRKVNAYLVCIITSFMILWCGTFAGSLIGFFQEGIGTESPVQNYIYKPMILVSFFGWLPTLVISIVISAVINRKIKMN